MSVEELLGAHHLTAFELLITDTEGYDYEILRGFDFSRRRPNYVHFEHGLSSEVMNWDRYKDLVLLLTKYGYGVAHESSDATAFLPSAIQATNGEACDAGSVGEAK